MERRAGYLSVSEGRICRVSPDAASEWTEAGHDIYMLCTGRDVYRYFAVTDYKILPTVPNEKPVVSPPVALSAGPIGIIVEFEIVEDGGEPVLTADVM